MYHERRYFTWCTDKKDKDVKPSPDVRDWLDSFLLNAETTEQLQERKDNMLNTLCNFKLAFTLSEQYANVEYTRKIEQRLKYVMKLRGVLPYNEWI